MIFMKDNMKYTKDLIQKNDIQMIPLSKIVETK
jgi:hypothetical protein